MGVSFWQILLVVILLVLLFGRGKISDLMGDVAKGIKSFKKGMSDDEQPSKPAEPKALRDDSAQPSKSDPDHSKSA